jgi:putative PIN family toxin of toxin-antitoxin system
VTRRSRPDAVVDTNIFVSGVISKRGNPAALIERWRRGDFTLLLSPPLYLELDEVLRRPKFTERYGATQEEIAALLDLVRVQGRQVSPRKRLPLRSRDPKDDKFLAAALAAKAQYLVTGDDDLLVLDGDIRLGGLRIVTVGTFLELLATCD